MTTNDTGTIWAAESTYFIVEKVVSKPIQVLGIPKTPIGLDHDQLVRNVYQLRAEHEVNFMGKPLGRQAGIKEAIVEWLLEGEQITTGTATGKKEWFLVSTNWVNLITPPGSKTYKVGPTISLLGDPIPGVFLYGNSKITFSSGAGLDSPTAAAIYDKASGKLKPVNPANKAAIMDQLKI